MQVRCPKCNACYELDDSIVSNKQRKLRCSKCKEIFIIEDLLVEKAKVLDETLEVNGDIKEIIQISDRNSSIGTKTRVVDGVSSQISNEDETRQNSEEAHEEHSNVDVNNNQNDEIKEYSEEEAVNLEAIFARLSEHTENLIAKEGKLPIHEKIWFKIKDILGFHFRIKWLYVLLVSVIFILLSSYNNRYQIVRTIPVLNSVYDFFGIKAKIPGEGLEFGNISWDFINEEGNNRLEIKGFINNITQKEIVLPIVHIEILDKDTVLLQSQNRKMKEETIAGNSKIPLSLTIKSPAPTAKYVYLTFIDED
jgi:predicted Zn finger-like uncharacterized protein